MVKLVLEARLVSLVLKDLPVIPERTVPLEPRAPMVPLVPRALQVLLVTLVSLVIPVPMVHQGQMVPMELRALPELLVLLVLLASLVMPDLLGHKVPLVTQAFKGLRVLLVLLVLLARVFPVLKGLMVLLVLLGPPVLLALLVTMASQLSFPLLELPPPKWSMESNVLSCPMTAFPLVQLYQLVVRLHFSSLVAVELFNTLNTHPLLLSHSISW